MSDGPRSTYEPLLRLGSFVAVFAMMAIWEAWAPRRSRQFSRRQRWPHNIALLVIDVAIVRIVAPGVAIAVALAGEANGWGSTELHCATQLARYRAQPCYSSIWSSIFSM